MRRTVKIGESFVEYDAEATRDAYATIDGGITSCTCDYCANYRLVREQIYPQEFRYLLVQLGIDYLKEIELTHLPQDDCEENLPYGQSCYGHYAFVGRILERAPSPPPDESRFCYAVTSNDEVHPVTRGTFGNSPQFIDLVFLVPRVPNAQQESL